MSSALSERYRVEPVRLTPGMSPEAIFAAYELTCPPRVGTLRDPSRKTYGTAVARIAAKLGQPLMPWQRYAADTALEVDPATGWLVYRDVTLVVPRQSGKTTLILSVKAHRALKMGSEAVKYRPSQGDRQFILYAAQKLLAARRKFVEEHLPLLEKSPFSGRFKPRLTNGSESILWDTGALDGITANTETSGHGPSLDLGVEDEFWAAEDHRLEQAFSPAMITRWSPQHWRVSTEGTERSTYMAEKVELGRLIVASGEPTKICYLEWSDLDGPRDDPRTWLSCMPALCPTPGECRCSPFWRHTVTLDVIAGELEKFKSTPEEFDRAYLNRRRGLVLPPDPNVPTVEQWRALADPRAVPGDPVAFAIEVNFDRKHSAIVSVGPHPDGTRRAVEVIDYRPGTDWIVARAGELRDRWNPVAWGLAIGGPAGALLQPLADVGIVAPGSEKPGDEGGDTQRGRPGEPKRGQLWIPNSRELGAACGALVDAVHNKTLAHRDDPRLNAAIASARTRPMGDAWMFARRAGGDVALLVATTVGLAAYEARKHLAVEDTGAPNIW